MSLLDINYILFKIGDYPLSFIELFGTIFGLLSVYWAARANIFTWPAGILNEFGFFVLFYQVQLYADMFLQVFFFAVTIFGWRNWQKNKQESEVRVSQMRNNWRLYYLLILVVGTALLGWEMSQLHTQLPNYFPQKAAYPYPDAFTTMTSVLATFLLAQRRWESWLLWILVDIVAVILYTYKGIYVIAGEYVIFLVIASFGLYNWYKKYRQQKE